jgi:hypothetical protein
MNWYFQYTPGDMWDYDEVGTHILLEGNVDGQQRKLITHSARNGFLYTMERANGAMVAVKPYMDNVNWTKGIDPKTGFPVMYSRIEPQYLWGQVRVEYVYTTWQQAGPGYYPLQSYRVTPVRDGNGPLQYRVSNPDGGDVYLPERSVFHLRNVSLDGIVGLSIVACARGSIGLGLAAEQFGTRVVLLRTGIALGPDGGALQRMLLPFRLGLGGPIAGGRHWMPWIHAEDAVSLIEFAINTASLNGAVNAVSPNPVRNTEFTQELARALHRPAIFPIPAFALDLLFGEMAEILTDSQRVIPRAALDAGFVFQFVELRPAVADLLLK